MQFQIRFESRSFRFHSYSAEDGITRRMQKYGTFYEWDLLAYSRGLLAELPAGGLVVDVGANLGNHALFWGAYAGRTVIAVEANPALAPILTENLRSNLPTEAYRVVAGGAGAEAALARVRLSSRAPDQFGLAGVSIEPGLSAGEAGVFEIQPLPTWLGRLGLAETPVRLLKIDVEGAEIDVLRGAAGILERDRPEVIAEAATIAERTTLEQALAAWGYRRVMRFCSTPTWHFSTCRDRWTLARLRRRGAAARLTWRWLKLRHSLRSRLRRAA